MTGTRRTLLTATLAAMLFVLSVPVSQAAHHLVRIREVFPGTTGDVNAEFVELQLTAAGESLVNGTQVRFYSAAALEGTPAGFTANPANGENQRTILVGSPAAETMFPTVQMDLEYPDSNRIDPAGGAVCFDSPTLFMMGIDCMSWGTFPAATVLPSPHANPRFGPVPNGASLVRSIAPACPTLHELADDTNNSAADFLFELPSPRPNSVAPTETVCTPGSGTSTPATGTTTNAFDLPAAIKKCKKKFRKGKKRNNCIKKAKAKEKAIDG